MNKQAVTKSFSMALAMMAFLAIILYAVFVLADSNPPASLHFEGNSTTNYDGDGIFSLNWTAGGGDAAANYTVWMSSNAGANWGQYFNDSATGYLVTGGIDAENYTFNVQAVNATGNETANVSSSWLYIDQTVPTITLPVYTNATFRKNTQTLTLNISVSDSGAGPSSSCIIDIQNTTDINQTIACSGDWCNGTVSLAGIPDGNKTIRVHGNDSVGNAALNNAYVVQIDSTNPLASFGTNPVNAYNSSSSTVVFDFKCSDNLGPISNIKLYTNFSGGWTANYTSTSYTNNDTWLNISVPGISEGYYIWAAWCNDSAGNSDLTNTNRTLTVDVSAPDITLTLSDYSIRKGDSITASCNASDDNGVANVTVTSNDGTTICTDNDADCSGTYEPDAIGDKTITCTVYDTLSNVDTESATLDVNPTLGGGGGGGGGGIPPEVTPEQPTEIDYSLGSLGGAGGAGGGLNASENETFSFILNGTLHTGRITEITEDSVTLYIWSEPIKVTLEINETKQIDVNGNGYNDLNITLKGISGGKADLLFKEIQEVIPSTPPSTTPPAPEAKKPFPWLWIIIGVVVVALVILIIVAVTARKKEY